MLTIGSVAASSSPQTSSCVQRALPLAQHAQQLEQEDAQGRVGGALAHPRLQQREGSLWIARGDELLGRALAHLLDATSSVNEVEAPPIPVACWRLYSISIRV